MDEKTKQKNSWEKPTKFQILNFITSSIALLIAITSFNSRNIKLVIAI